MIKLAIATVLLAHGVGHVLFLAPTLKLADWAAQTGWSWALAPLVGDGVARLMGSALWAVAIMLFVAAAGGYLVDSSWWRVVAIGGAVASGIGIIVMWSGIATTNAVLTLAVDVIVVALLLWTRASAATAAGA